MSLPAQDASRYGVVSQLADDLAHEIKNPLSSIGISLELMRQRLARGDAALALERVDVTEQELQRVHDLVDGLLRLLRPHKDGPGPYSVAETAAGVGPLLSAQARSAAVSLNWGAVPVEAYTAVPPDALRIALIACGTILIHAARSANSDVTLDCQVTNGEIVLVLKTAGALGVAPSGGDALGLARDLLRGAGGTITTNQRSSFEIRLPLAKH